ALVFLAHGYAEHCHGPCYDMLARKLVEMGCYVFSHDHVGHGKSEGPRALVKSADIYVDDILTHVDLVKQKYPSRPVFLFGHSMGGTMCVGSALERPKQFSGMVLNAPALWLDPVQCSWTKVTVPLSLRPARASSLQQGGLLVALAAERRPQDIAGIVMMAPMLAVDKEQASWLKMTLARILGRIVPTLPIGNLDLSLVSKDPEIVARMTNDPLRYHGRVRVGWAAAMLNALEDLQAKVDSIDTPFFIQHGSADKLCDIGGSEDFYKKAPTKDKSFKVYKDCYHSLLTEPEEMAQQVLQDIANWYSARIPS
ncbi:hypothetical protein MTO96_041566, partial [Rhipicephalus appendiculatus]